VTYDAVIDVDNTDLRLRPGMTANVTVVYAERKDVLAISNAALRFRGPPSAAGDSAGPTSSGGARQHRGHDAGAPAADPDAPVTKSIWVLRGNTPEQVTIHTGLTDGTVTEVIDGLNEGDGVIIDLDNGDGAGASPSSTRSTSLRPMF